MRTEAPTAVKDHTGPVSEQHLRREILHVLGKYQNLKQTRFVIDRSSRYNQQGLDFRKLKYDEQPPA